MFFDPASYNAGKFCVDQNSVVEVKCINSYQLTQCHIPEHMNIFEHLSENPKFHIHSKSPILTSDSEHCTIHTLIRTE